MMNPIESARARLEHQRRVGAVPQRVRDVPGWLARIGAEAPQVELSFSAPDAALAEAVARAFVRLGATASASGERMSLCFPADAHALGRCLEILALTGPSEASRWLAPLAAKDWAAEILTALDRTHRASAAPEQAWSPGFALPMAIAEAEAAGLGYAFEPTLLALILTNVALEPGRSRLIPTGEGPIVAFSADYHRVLAHLTPPALTPYPWEEARTAGVPTLRLPRVGLLKRGLRVSPVETGLRCLGDTEARLAQAHACLGELEEAWPGQLGSTVVLGWPVYLPRDGGGGVLDGVAGAALPELPPFFAEATSNLEKETRS